MGPGTRCSDRRAGEGRHSGGAQTGRSAARRRKGAEAPASRGQDVAGEDPEVPFVLGDQRAHLQRDTVPRHGARPLVQLRAAAHEFAATTQNLHGRD